MSEHTFPDAYQTYIERKRAAEAATVEPTLEITRLKRPPTMCLQLGRDERPLSWKQWLIRLPLALVTSIGIIGIPYLFPPERTDLTRAEIDHIDYRYMSGWPERTAERALAEIRAEPPRDSS